MTKTPSSVPYEETLMEDLADPAEAAAYLTECYDDSPEVFKIALRNVAKAHGGMDELAKKTGITREHLYTIMSKEGNPSFDYFTKIIKALDVQVQFIPATASVTTT